jgi:hypothetical protein
MSGSNTLSPDRRVVILSGAMGEILSLAGPRPIRCLLLIVLLPWSAFALAATTYALSMLPTCVASDKNITFPLNRIKVISVGSATRTSSLPARLTIVPTSELPAKLCWLARSGNIHEWFRLPLKPGSNVYAAGAYESAGA